MKIKRLKLRKEIKLIMCCMLVIAICASIIAGFKNESKDVYGNECHGTIVKICSSN